MKLKLLIQVVALTLLSAIGMLTFQNCSATQFSKTPLHSNDASTTAACVQDPVTGECLNLTAMSCNFNGASISAAGVITAYRNSTASAGESCISEQRRCTNGNLTGSYSFASCSVGTPASCLFNGATVANGRNVTAFQNSAVPVGSQCVAQLRVCNNGVLSGGFAFASCVPGNMNLSCRFGGRTYAHGENATAFLDANVPFGRLCLSQLRQCLNGIMSGSYENTACSQGSAAGCNFNGRTLANGESVPAFQVSSVPFGSTCPGQTRICRNGILDGSYNFNTCEAGVPKSCLFAGQTIASGEIIKAHLTSIVSFGKSCVTIERQCLNGILSGDTAYTQLSCTVEPAPPVVPPQPETVCLPSEVLSATQSYIKSISVPESAIIENCKDGINPTYQSNDPATSDSAAVRFFNTCGNRYCQQVVGNGSIEGRVVERYGGQVLLQCRRKDAPPNLTNACLQKFRALPEPIVVKSVGDQEVGTSCIDSENPALADNLPTTAAKTVRFNYTCGTRWCRKQGFSAGRVVENSFGSLQVNCYQEEIFNQLDAGTIATNTTSTINDVSILCQDAPNPLAADSYPSRSVFSQLRFVNTCGNRFCIQKGLGQSGWITDIKAGSLIEGLKEVTVTCIK